jgi:hypothetical protein
LSSRSIHRRGLTRMPTPPSDSSTIGSSVNSRRPTLLRRSRAVRPVDPLGAGT